MVLIPTKIFIDSNNVEFRIGDGSVVYKTDINSFEENSGLIIHNIEFSSLTGYYLRLGDINTAFNCGNIINNLDIELKRNEKSILLIIDFDEVTEVSNSFFKTYTKFLLETSNKVITINMNTAISNTFSDFIQTNITEETE